MIPAVARRIRSSARFGYAAADTLEAFGARSRLKNAPVDIDGAYTAVETFGYGEVRLAPFQIREEFTELLRRVQAIRPLRLLEIGTARGGTLFLFARVAAPGATLVTVDLPHGPFGGGYPLGHVPLLRSFGRDGQKIHLVRADSHAPATLQRVTSLLGGGVDFLFVDGDHTYNGVRLDYEMYAPLVRPGGLIAFHDIVDGPPEAVGGVPRFWDQLRSGRSHVEEIVADRKQGGWGIGLIVAHDDPAV